MRLTDVLQPIKINKVEVKNRIFRPAHGTRFGDGGVTDRMIAYHEERAKGGVGLSYLELVVVHPSAGEVSGIISWRDGFVESVRRLTDTMHHYDMKMFAQLWHGGRQVADRDGIAWSASHVPSPSSPQSPPRPMPRAMIQQVVEGFAQAAAKLKRAGIDGVEIHMGHGYLVHQFLSRGSNLRDDEYGGSLDNRMRFAREILAAVRASVGQDFPVGIRISDSSLEGALTGEDVAEIVAKLTRDDLIDFVNGSHGDYHHLPDNVPTMETPSGVMLPVTGPILAAAKSNRRYVVRMAVGRFQTIEEADQVIRSGVADMVGINRALIADPKLLTKTLAGHAETVRPCLGCNQGCLGGAITTGMACVVNVAVGREHALSEDLLEPAASPSRVVIVGGGPGGMEAARVAAMRGHHVVLFEAQADLGGALNIARRAPGLAALADIALWLEKEIYRLGVDVRLATYAEEAEIMAERPDQVIFATGSYPPMDGRDTAAPMTPIPGFHQPHVHSSRDIFDVPQERLGRSALIYDDTGAWEAVAAAEYLARAGLAVTFVTRHGQVAPRMAGIARIETLMRRLKAHDVTFFTLSRISSIGRQTAKITPVEIERPIEVDADIVVFAGTPLSLDVVYNAMQIEQRSLVAELVGDARSPRDIKAAIDDGHLVARNIGKSTRCTTKMA